MLNKMTDPLENILKVLQSKVSIVFSIGAAAAIFLPTFPIVIKFVSFEPELLKSLSFIIFISIIYLAAIAGLLLVICTLLGKAMKQIVRIKKTYNKNFKILAHINSDITMGELWLLQKQIEKGQRIFVAEQHGEGVYSLKNKGLIKENQHITHIKFEYEIPHFVWRSKKLKQLIKQTEDVSKKAQTSTSR